MPFSSRGCNAMDATTTSSGMVIAQTTMQYGHSAPMRYRLWKISQWMNPTPSSVPMASPPQYHLGNATLKTASTPVTTTTVKATMPMSGFGKPKAEACGVIITEPQDSTGLMLHDGT